MMKIFKIKSYIFIGLLTFTLFACDPFNGDAPEIGELPPLPEFTVTSIDTNNNYVVELINADDYFNFLISSETGKFRNPVKNVDKTTSNQPIDTVQFLNKGDQTISVNGLSREGGGNSVSYQEVSVPKDLGAQCTAILEFLVGDCTSDYGKCWTWPELPDELKVGPFPGSNEWFSSNGLQYEQYDDNFCFIFEGSQYNYDNYGASVFPFDGSFAAQEYQPPAWTFVLLEDEPIYETDHTLVLIPNGADKPWIGTWDSGPIYGIAEISEDELILRTEITDIDGNPTEGYFEFLLVPSN